MFELDPRVKNCYRTWTRYSFNTSILIELHNRSIIQCPSCIFNFLAKPNVAKWHSHGFSKCRCEKSDDVVILVQLFFSIPPSQRSLKQSVLSPYYFYTCLFCLIQPTHLTHIRRISQVRGNSPSPRTVFASLSKPSNWKLTAGFFQEVATQEWCEQNGRAIGKSTSPLDIIPTNLPFLGMTQLHHRGESE